jgi:hypothetical protein
MFLRLRRVNRPDDVFVAEPQSREADGSGPDTAETDLRAAIQAAYIEVQKAKIDRTFRAADAVTRAAGAIATIYTGLLALVYSVGSNPPRPLPARGIAPAVFLALAFFFSVVNVGFIRRTGRKVDVLEAAETWKQQQIRLNRFLQWVDRGALQRAWALRAGVVCLGAGVALLPLPFLALSLNETRAIIGAVAGITLAWLTYEAVVGWATRRRRHGSETRELAEPERPYPGARSTAARPDGR